MKESTVVITFVFIIFGLICIDQRRSVDVYICEHQQITSYVDREAPPQELKLGTCKIQRIIKDRYYFLKRRMNRGVR